jgi:hypothetical protein
MKSTRWGAVTAAARAIALVTNQAPDTPYWITRLDEYAQR